MEKNNNWLAEEKELEKKVLAEYLPGEVRKHFEFLTTLTRRAGTEDELKAANYIKQKLDEYGVNAEVYEIDAYISLPGEAEIEVLSPVVKSIPCLPRTFIPPTPPGGVEAELISLGKGLEQDYQGRDVRGKIVLVEPAYREGRLEVALIAEQKGSVAQIHVTPGTSQAMAFGQLRFTWGNPTPETIDKVPKIPAVSIRNSNGRYLAELTKTGPVVVRLKADTWRGYRNIKLPMGFVTGEQEPEKFVLFGGHYCSWFLGASDNAAANSLMLEMARIFQKHRKHLGRSIRFAWWAGHEQGTYAGSTWYGDRKSTRLNSSH
jgi:Iap family predicted aminopeptidase